jgi:superfamily I DNA/RNA helicase
MRILKTVTPTQEQLPLLLHFASGVLVIRGAAGSGKTTTALMRLKQLCAYWTQRKRRLGLPDRVRVLVLTYNRTLEGYISELARQQIEESPDLELRVTTFGRFAVDVVGHANGPDDWTSSILEGLLRDAGFPIAFGKDEVEYVLGRFEADDLEAYLTVVREGRGTSPRMDTAARRRLLDDVVFPYVAEKAAASGRDWNDVTVLARDIEAEPWDVVIVDEAQDFSANQVRTILAHLAPEHSLTFVMDTAQRIYPRSFTWSEAGITDYTSRRLTHNYRNTKEIAAFARGLIDGMTFGDDGTLPDFDAAEDSGTTPAVLVGRYSQQFDWVLRNVVSPANVSGESVAFLHPLGGGWFSYLKTRLDSAGVEWVQLTRASSWPDGDETVALSTIHSAKGLEFDHIVILGLNQQVTPHGDEDGDAKLEALRRLLAMGIGRARRSVTLGFKAGEASTLIDLLDPTTFVRVTL